MQTSSVTRTGALTPYFTLTSLSYVLLCTCAVYLRIVAHYSWHLRTAAECAALALSDQKMGNATQVPQHCENMSELRSLAKSGLPLIGPTAPTAYRCSGLKAIITVFQSIALVDSSLHSSGTDSLCYTPPPHHLHTPLYRAEYSSLRTLINLAIPALLTSNLYQTMAFGV